MKKIILTGNRGFIGSKLQIELKKRYEVFGCDLKSGKDIRNLLELERIFESESFDAVVHLAALAGVRRGEEFPEEYISTNITGTQNLVNLAKKYKVEKFISYSSSSVLGGNANKDFGLTEIDRYNPKSIYAITKVAGEYIVKNSGLDYFIIRPFTVYGKSGRPDMVIYKWINQIKKGEPISFYGDGQTSRGYTNVKELVAATGKCLDELFEHHYSEVLNLGGCERISLDELLKIFIEFSVKHRIIINIDRMDLPDVDVIHSFADTSKVRKFIRFNPKPVFRETVKKILEVELL